MSRVQWIFFCSRSCKLDQLFGAAAVLQINISSEVGTTDVVVVPLGQRQRRYDMIFIYDEHYVFSMSDAQTVCVSKSSSTPELN